jgi:hypothetical protein
VAATAQVLVGLVRGLPCLMELCLVVALLAPVAEEATG